MDRVLGARPTADSFRAAWDLCEDPHEDRSKDDREILKIRQTLQIRQIFAKA